MPRREFELGNRRKATLRSAPDFPLGGMYLEGDPGKVPPNRLRHAENVRFKGGNVLSRGGLSRVNTDTFIHATDATIIDLQDFQARTKKVYPVFDGCPGLDASTGFSLSWYDHDQEPRFQRGIYYSSATSNMVVGIYDGRLYIGRDDTLLVFQLIVSPYGSESISFSGSEQAEKFAVFTGFVISALQEFDGKLFIGLDAGAGASKIAVWDGLTIHDGTNGTSADLTGIDPPSRFCKIRDKLAVGFSTNPSGIRLRDPGDPAGTWTALIAGAIASKHMVAYKDNLYITDGSTSVWRYNFSALATVRTVAGSTMFGLTDYNDGSAEYLFYGYQSSGNAAIIGRYDGSSFVDVHYNITATYSEARLPRVLREYRGALWAGVNTAANGGRIYQSVGNDTDGTIAYQRTIPSALLNGDLFDAVAF